LLFEEGESGALLAAVHAVKYGLRIFDHILTGLTIVVHPSWQGRGLGKALFTAFLRTLEASRPDIRRVELESRASNTRSIGLYQSLGFVPEGVLRNKTRNADGSFEDSLLMAWTAPEG
ncbi:MAG TPA: GNAT family N-acetyltransferase, partial [Chitinophagaceae bacterium]|nr:GNAT family N-acetyltransferase [Chitinophagaceae bacterium]